MSTRFSCPDWWERLQAGKVPMANVPLNEKNAALSLAFFNRLRLPDVAGNPPLATACGDWFKEIVVAYLASEDPITKQKTVWELLCVVPKKSSKTTYTAALALTALFMCEVPNGTMLIVAPSQNISQRCFDQAQAMIRLDEHLIKIFSIQDHLKTITHNNTGTTLQVKTFDTSIVTGEIPIHTFIDEPHVLGYKNNAQAVLQQIRGGGITQNGGQIMFITTQSDRRPAGIWKSELNKGRAIRDGKAGTNPIMLPVIYEFPERLQKDETFWRDKKNWKFVLPNLGISINQDRLENDYENNGKVSSEAERIWMSQHLNIEIGVGLHDDRWSGGDFWEAAGQNDLSLESIIESSEVLTIGIDPGGQDDLLAFSLIGRHKVTKVWQHWAKLWAGKIALERRKSIATILQDFAAAGDLSIAEELEKGAYCELAELCVKIRETGLLPSKKSIGIDSAGKAASLAIDCLEACGFIAKDHMEAVSQGYKLNDIIGTVAIKLEGGSFVHSNQDIMAWCVENCRMEASKNAEYPSKAESGAGKIDGLMSLFNAAKLMSFHPEAGGRGSMMLDMEAVLV